MSACQSVKVSFKKDILYLIYKTLTSSLLGMEERISSLEAELQRSKTTTVPRPTPATPTPTTPTTTTAKQEDETSSDGGIESGTEVDGEIV